MKYTLKSGKVVNIPDSDLKRLMDSLDLDEETAIDIWLEDEGYLENEEQNELDKKAKDSKITQTIHGARADTKKKRVVVRKADETKESIISALADLLKELADEVEIVNVGKLITFKLGEDSFKLDLIRQRKPKK